MSSTPQRPLRERIRGRLKRPAAALLRPALRRRSGTLGLIVAYHAVRPREPAAPEVVSMIGRDRLREHLDLIRLRYTVVPLAELLAAATRRRRGEPYPIAVTFDDDLDEHVDQALPLLDEIGLPATFFLCGRDLLGDGEFWWETLQRAVDGGASPDELGSAAGAPAAGARDLRELAARLEALPDDELEAAHGRLRALAGAAGPGTNLDRARIARLADRHTVGFHTRRHRVLTRLGDPALRQALDDGRDALAAAVGGPIDAIAYPHGKVDGRVAGAARAAGFSIGLGLGGLAASPRGDALCLDRLPADELSVDELDAALAAALLRASSVR